VVVSPPPVVVAPPPVCTRYQVLFRGCPHEPWQEYATYGSPYLAGEAEALLLQRGYQARVAPF
jgi:hypothetical protein